MKIFSVFIILIISITSSCGSRNTQMEHTYTGTIEAAGITSYQYGTHLLRTDDEEYALKSENINLKDYEGKKVMITAKKIDDYPIEGGPVYLSVLKVENL